ncbi:hypothetical protein GO013_05930 [Pseudodesulfovibrio sp. JC047]|uniref:hypothetical protein n=1 Tax=Pseudodesulfovibrio sp. JC047 TaxID=2683199 RepID=UPI0013CFDD18|nr:hypothetical protein [Pseudodesulfovibrio sp. JC047]NDV18958.1 hypothetical protein [Pseudodesulfovibrio sp. JC047]
MTTFNDSMTGSIDFSVRWEHNDTLHEERFLGQEINPVHDIFPRGFREALEGKKVGDSVTQTYPPQMLSPRHSDDLVQTYDLDRLRSRTVLGEVIIPRVGRFYPQGYIDGLPERSPDTLTPFRMTALDETTFTADHNHPLANFPVTITATVHHLETRTSQTDESPTDWVKVLCDCGPGMQTPLADEPTDFFHPAFFNRLNTDHTPFVPPVLDSVAQKNLEAAYVPFISTEMRVLDFSMGTERPHGKYDAARCVCSIEYMDRPVDIIRYISHFLTPGAPVLIAFSNRFDANNTIQGWTELHEFERMGLVLEYLRYTKLDANAGTLSIRNNEKGQNDPIYLVYGHKAL